MDGIEKLRIELSRLYEKYHRAELLSEDPLGLVGAHLSPADFELVSYVSAALAYGRVEQIRKSLGKLWQSLESCGLGPGGAGLHALLVDKSGKTLKKDFGRALAGWVHRFNNAADLLVLFAVLQRVVKSQGDLGSLYARDPTRTPTEKLKDFVAELRGFARGPELAAFKWFACSPAEGSTCKRMVMWLRWMLRSDEIDPGLWSQRHGRRGVGAHLAFIPMDTHVHQWATQRGLLSTKSPSWKAVEELSAVLRQVDPLDPARFDFCICHAGMAQFRDRLGARRVQRTL